MLRKIAILTSPMLASLMFTGFASAAPNSLSNDSGSNVQKVKVTYPNGTTIETEPGGTCETNGENTVCEDPKN